MTEKGRPIRRLGIDFVSKVATPVYTAPDGRACVTVMLTMPDGSQEVHFAPCDPSTAPHISEETWCGRAGPFTMSVLTEEDYKRAKPHPCEFCAAGKRR